MQIRLVKALTNGREGRDISGNKVSMAINTFHLISEVDVEYYLDRPQHFTVSPDVDIVVYAYNEDGVINGFRLPDGTIQPLGADVSEIISDIVALQAAIVTAQAGLVAAQAINTTQSTAISTLQTLTASQSALIVALQESVAALQDGQQQPESTVVSINNQAVAEGETLTFTAILSATTPRAQIFTFSIGGTATAGTDYASPVVIRDAAGTVLGYSGNSFILPAGNASFTASTLTSSDATFESSETLTFTSGGFTGTGTITNVDNTPATIASIVGADTNEGGYLEFIITFNKPTIAGQSFTPTLSGAA